jgi:hypothetical protein
MVRGDEAMIVLTSLWRNDAGKDLKFRANHLLSKTSSNGRIRWLWVVGDSDDDTETALRDIAYESPHVTVLNVDTNVDVTDLDSRRLRFASAANYMFERISGNDSYACLHESDLVSPDNVVDLLLANPSPVAGWPVIRLHGEAQFYDIWAYRDMKGRTFKPSVKRPNRLLEVSSFGSVWLAPAELVKGRVMGEGAVVDLCTQWRDEGVRLWCDPSIIIVQPVDLWTPR